MEDIKSVLKMNKLVFDKIEFDRLGFRNQNKPNFKIEARFAKNEDDNIYRITLLLKCEKEEEYSFEIVLTGYFSFDSSADISEKDKNELITKNTIAIIMPYMRSQVSLLTAQPEVDCVVLPPFNINSVLENEDLNEKE